MSEPSHSYALLTLMLLVQIGLIQNDARNLENDQNPGKWVLIRELGLGSIRKTSMDRESRKIDVQHERTSIAELDTPPPTSIVFPTP